MQSSLVDISWTVLFRTDSLDITFNSSHCTETKPTTATPIHVTATQSCLVGQIEPWPWEIAFEADHNKTSSVQSTVCVCKSNTACVIKKRQRYNQDCQVPAQSVEFSVFEWHLHRSASKLSVLTSKCGMSLVKRQFVITHTIRQVPALFRPKRVGAPSKGEPDETLYTIQEWLSVTGRSGLRRKGFT
jgi:hypothetical protein